MFAQCGGVSPRRGTVRVRYRKGCGGNTPATPFTPLLGVELELVGEGEGEGEGKDEDEDEDEGDGHGWARA